MSWEVRLGDCLIELQKLADNSVDAFIMDPPYCQGSGVASNGVGASTKTKYVQSGQKRGAALLPSFVGDHRTQRGLARFLERVFFECYRALKPGGQIMVCFDFRNLVLCTDALQIAGFLWHGLVVWDKTVACRPMRPFKRQCEYIAFASKGSLKTSVCLPGVVQARSKHEFHQTQKPDAVMDHLLQAIEPGALVIDPFCGSGSTGVAALKRGCQFIGIELVPEIAEIARTRLEQVNGRRE
ncbi:MAG: DNA-methyltransferase [Burkholderiaceae bacterium]